MQIISTQIMILVIANPTLLERGIILYSTIIKINNNVTKLIVYLKA